MQSYLHLDTSSASSRIYPGIMLIVLRGNAASGKSTVARLLQERLDGPAALLSQDLFRRGIYAEREQDSLEYADLLEAAARHCLGRGHHVILDGIFHAGRYGPMLERVAPTSEGLVHDEVTVFFTPRARSCGP